MTDPVRSLTRRDTPVDLVGRMNPYADRLHTAVQILLTQRSVSISPFRNLAREILLDVRERPPLGTVLPESEPPPSEQPISPTASAESSVYTTGIQTARLMAWAVSHRQAWLDRRELLTIAALLQDVGLLLVKSAYRMTPRQLRSRRPQTFRRHPEFGAALAGGLTGCAVDLPRLIAQHHERLDGTGYPRQPPPRRLSETARFLAIAVRFVELCHEFPEQDHARSNRARYLTTAGLNAAVSQRAAAETLFHEAARGDWDLTLTVAFLESLGFQVSDEQLFSDETPRHMTLSRFGRRMLRAEPPHSVVPSPHVASVRRTAAESLHTESLHAEQHVRRS